MTRYCRFISDISSGTETLSQTGVHENVGPNLALSLLVLSAPNLHKQFESRSGPTKMSGLIWI